MRSLPEVIEKCGPALVAAADQPLWACVFEPSDCPECGADDDERGPEDDFCIELWAGGPFTTWFPPQQPAAVIVVLPATGRALLLPPPAARRHDRNRARGPRGRPNRALAQQTPGGQLICAVSEDGGSYAIVIDADGSEVHGVPTRGRFLDLVRSKLFLPPGPFSDRDLEMTPL